VYIPGTVMYSKCEIINKTDDLEYLKSQISLKRKAIDFNEVDTVTHPRC